MMRRVVAAAVAVTVLGGMGPALAAAGDGPRGDVGGSSVAKASERIDNLRLQRITSGSMRGRLVVAGSLDHLPAPGAARDVVVRMTMSVPRGGGSTVEVARKVLRYLLPAHVSPRDMTLRWVLGEGESRIVRRAGDAARVSVVVRESRPGGRASMVGTVEDRLPVEPHTNPPSYANATRSTVTFIPAGYYSSDENATFYLWTAEDPSGAPYVGGFGYGGSAANNYEDYWALDPLWMMQGAESGSPGPGGGYIYMDGSVPSWSMSTLWMPDCTETASGSGTFSGSSNAAMSWPAFYCSPDVLLYAAGGSASLTVMQ